MKTKTQIYVEQLIQIIGTGRMSANEIGRRFCELNPELAPKTLRKLLYDLSHMNYPILSAHKHNMSTGGTLLLYEVARRDVKSGDVSTSKNWPTKPAPFDAVAAGYTQGDVPTLAQMALMMVAAVNQPMESEK